ncbi:hypothetical protein C8034_v003204 [Colletotrichum sidae]|uniref:Uncharacterized protein n=1 Tax=Colletotrichum sidae TaxID=1347389 RepID=A0A4R8TAT7_9PEZI|nr:hypothetical protein C8034_v003204 [Colletotrichum sidae]
MRFSMITVLSLAATVQETVASSCRIVYTKHACCWGGKNGLDACRRQRGGANVCNAPSMEHNFCQNVERNGTDIRVSETCDADCCSTVTGHGISCPS